MWRFISTSPVVRSGLFQCKRERSLRMAISGGAVADVATILVEELGVKKAQQLVYRLRKEV